MEGFWFLVKKLLGRLLFPVGLTLSLGLLGLILWHWRPRARWGPLLAWTAWVVLFILSLPVVAYLLMRPLEQSAGPYADPARLAALGVSQVVVLGGAVNPGEEDHPGDRLGSPTLRRLLEGVRLWRAIPGAKLVLSGGNYLDGEPVAQAMADMAVSELGVPREALVLEQTSWDTEDEARILARQLGDRPFALVTSASHMRRAMRFFQRLGLKPQAAPVDFRTRGFNLGYENLTPDASGLYGSQKALYEHLGWWWLNLKGLVAPAPRRPAPDPAGS